MSRRKEWIEYHAKKQYAKLNRIAMFTERRDMNPATHAMFMRYLTRAQEIIRLEAEQAGVTI